MIYALVTMAEIYKFCPKNSFQHLTRFFTLLDEYIAKICKKLNSSMSYLQGSVANPAHPAALFSLSCYVLKKELWDLNFLDIFATS